MIPNTLTKQPNSIKNFNFYNLLTKQYEEFQQEFHNCFGEKKGRMKLIKRRYLGHRAHLRKEIPIISLINLYEKEEEVDNIASFLNLENNNNIERFSRVFFIYKMDLHSRWRKNINPNTKEFLKIKRRICRKILQKIGNYHAIFELNKKDIINNKKKSYAVSILRQLNQFYKPKPIQKKKLIKITRIDA